MSSSIQVISIIYSFIFGIVFCFITSICRRFSNVFIKVISSLFVVVLMSVTYMYILYKINYGILHEYFILMMLFGYVICRVKICKLVK